jgi:hypothetical protein
MKPKQIDISLPVKKQHDLGGNNFGFTVETYYAVDTYYIYRHVEQTLSGPKNPAYSMD